MGTYLGVNAVKKYAGNYGPIKHPNEKQPDVPPGCFLVVIVCNGVWSIAPEVTDKSEYDEFYNSFRAGNWLSFEIYAVNESDRDKCPDEGRVPCDFRS